MSIYQELQVDLDHITMNYVEVVGHGRPLLLIHGGSNHWRSFEGVLPELQTAGYHLFAPDLRGHGRSSRATDGYRLTSYRDDVVRFMQAVIGRPAFIYGHSLGGMIALMVAADFPDGVLAVAVGDAPLSKEAWLALLKDGRPQLEFWRQQAGGQKTMAELIEIIKNLPADPTKPDDPVRLRQAWGEDSPTFAAMASFFFYNDPLMLDSLLMNPQETAAGYDRDRLFSAIDAPVLLLQADSERGGLMGDDDLVEIGERYGSTKHVRLPGVGHAIHNERPAEVIKALTEFLNEAGPATGERDR